MVLLLVCLLAVSQEPMLQNVEQRQSRFLENRINEPGARSALNSGEIESISNTFLRLGEAFPDEGNRMLFRMAVTQHITDPERIYTILEDEINTDAHRRATPNLARELQRYNLSQEQAPLISQIIFDRAKQLTLYGYMYKHDEQTLNEKTNLIESDYQRTLQTVLTRQGIRTNLSKYCLALDWKDLLSLTEDQVEQVLSAGWDLFERNRIEKIVSIRDVQHRAATGILNNEQYDLYLTNLVMDKAIEETQAVWNEAARLGLTAQFDHAVVYPELLAYYLERAKIFERFKIYPDRQHQRDELLYDLSINHKPVALKQIDTKKDSTRAR